VTAAATRCMDDAPISWLRLERHELGDATKEESALISAHLSSCDACAAVARKIRDDAALSSPLRPLPAKNVVPLRAWYTKPQTMAIVGALAIAALLVLVLSKRGGPPSIPSEEDPMRDPNRVKGTDADVSFVLVGDDASSSLIAEAGSGLYTDGE